MRRVEGKREIGIREFADVDKEVQIQRQTTSTTKITHLWWFGTTIHAYYPKEAEISLYPDSHNLSLLGTARFAG
jgi:hypothetical protein